jgi:hypothetical protein
MAHKNDRPLPDERIDGVGTMIEGLGKRARIARAKRKPAPQRAAPGEAASAQMQVMAQLAGGGRAAVPWLSQDLHSAGLPTLADRVRKDGIAAYGKSFAQKAKAAKNAPARAADKR